jgi:hypothetical protein
MPPCATSIIDIGPNLLQVVVQLLTLVGTAYGITHVLATEKAVKRVPSLIISNGKGPATGSPK